MINMMTGFYIVGTAIGLILGIMIGLVYIHYNNKKIELRIRFNQLSEAEQYVIMKWEFGK